MSGIKVLNIDGSRLGTAEKVTLSVHSIYRELRRQRRVAAVVSGASASTRPTHATQSLARALDEAGVPHAITDSRTLNVGTSGADRLRDEAPVLLIADSATRAERDSTEIADTDGLGAPPLRVVLLGLGTVGLGVFRHLSAQPERFDVRRVVVRDPVKHCNDGVPSDRLSNNLWHAINEPADIVIELIGGLEPAADIVHAALLRGRTVVTANKTLIAERWNTFERYARQPHPRLHFSAAVGGSLPVLETIEEVRRKHSIARVRAVINGTCNFVLDELASGSSLADAVALAQRKGFAEADPHADLSGADAAQKLCLIARAALEIALSPRGIDYRGIEHLTPAAIADHEVRGSRLRLVATCAIENSVIRAHVRPEALGPDDFLAGARREENRVEIITTAGEVIQLSGKGAGRWPTALSVMGDVHEEADQLKTRSDRRGRRGLPRAAVPMFAELGLGAKTLRPDA